MCTIRLMVIRGLSLLKVILMAKLQLTSLGRIQSPGGFASAYVYTHRNCFTHRWHSAVTVSLEQASSPVKCHFIICLSEKSLDFMLDLWLLFYFQCYNVLKRTSSNLGYTSFSGKNKIKLISSGKRMLFSFSG